MKKLLKIGAVLAAVCVVLLIAAFITLKIMFPAEKLKAMAQNFAVQNLHREVEFSDVSFNLIGVTLSDFALSESTTFADGTFVKADKAIVKVALMPLLKKRIEISTVGLEGLTVNVINNKNGKFNFDDLLTADTNTPPTPTAEENTETSPFGFALTAEHIYATDCNLYYKDLQNGMDASVTKLNIDIKDFDLAKPFDATISFSTDYQDAAGLNVVIPVNIALTADLAGLDMAKAYATLNSLTLNYKNIKLALQGGAKNFNAPIIDLKGKISGLSNTALNDILPDLPAFVLPDILFSASAEANLDTSTAMLKQAKLSLADSAISVKGNAGWGETNPTYNMTANINVNMSQVAQMAEMLSGYGIGGAITGQVNATDKKNGQDVRGNIKLDKLGLVYDSVEMSELTGNIVIKSLEDISCSALSGKINKEPFTSSFAYKNLSGVLDLVFNFDLSKLTLERFPGMEAAPAETQTEASNSSTDATSTTLTADGPETFFNIKANVKIGQIKVPFFTSQGFSATADLKKASATMKQASGTVTFTLQEGAVTDLDGFVKENRIVKILLLPLSLVNKVTSKLGVDILPKENKEDKGQIKFTSGSGTYQFVNGLMTLQETHFDSAVSNIKGSGSINFKSEALDMRVSATVLTSQTPIVVKIGGTLSNPSGKLDVAGTAVSLVGGILNYKTPGKVVGSAAQTTGEVTKTTVNTTVDAATDLVKGISSLFKKKEKTETKE